jgi:putative flavoprotein involved in K+ transport
MLSDQPDTRQQASDSAARLPGDVDVLIIGAGQAGLGAAHWLHRSGVHDVVLVDGQPVGQSWLERWDSLQLFTPRRFSALPGLRFPLGAGRSPSRVEMAAYLRDYADRLPSPVRVGVHVESLTYETGAFVATTSAGCVRARQVVLATGPFRRPYVPAAAEGLEPSVRQLHSFEYRRPSDVPPDAVLIVGGGNSAAQLAIELARTHEVTVASPGPLWFLAEDILGVSMYWWTLLTGVLNARGSAWISRYIRRRGDAIVGRELRELVERGQVRLVPHRVVAGAGDRVTCGDGSVLFVASVLWCTGFRPDTSWIDIPGATDAAGPVHVRGASPVGGLHWMGLPWQTRLNSSIIDGVDRDGRRTARRVAQELQRVLR